MRNLESSRNIANHLCRTGEKWDLNDQNTALSVCVNGSVPYYVLLHYYAQDQINLATFENFSAGTPPKNVFDLPLECLKADVLTDPLKFREVSHMSLAMRNILGSIQHKRYYQTSKTK